MQQRNADNKAMVVTHEQQNEFKHKAESVNQTDKAEGKTIGDEERRKQEQEQRKNHERQKQIARRLVKDTGHIIDLEA
ncbi:hypothetical protein [Seleniivibrio woodruffii]|uniref:hypothetical protein n=1 Tax=Seleniivibrio woodruffii TaxID=1078050 RepID=UPI0026F0B12E|nr:hypothetical protein [Seleniivibrio woodruffii]